MAMEKRVFAILNTFVLLTAAITIIITNMKGDDVTSPCEYQDTNGWTAIFARFALAISVVGLGNLVTSWKYKRFRKLYLWSVVALGMSIFILLGMALFFIGLGPSDNGYKFSILERHWTNPKSWKPIHECLVQNDVCKGILPTSQTTVLPELDYNKVMQSHCCRPPAHCSFLKINSTYWVTPSKDPDCRRWMDNFGGPTFDADYCKRGYIQSVFNHWLSAIFINCLIWTFCLTICLFCEEHHLFMMKRNQKRTFKAVEKLKQINLPQP